MTQRIYTIADFLESRSATAPSFSPSGRRVAYLSNLSGTFQVYVAPVSGEGDAVQVTDYADPISLAEFSPVDEDELIFAKDEGGNERHQLYLLNLETGLTTVLTSDHSAMHRFGGWSRNGCWIAYASHKRNGTDHDIYVLDLETMQEQMVFDLGGWCDCFGFSPSGRYLVVSKTKSGGYLDTELYLVDLDGSEPPRLLTPHKEKAYYVQAEWLPDESGFWTLTDHGHDLMNAKTVAIATARKLITTSQSHTVLGRNIEQIALSKDGLTIADLVNIDGYSGLIINPSLYKDIPRGQATGLTWSRDGEQLAFALSGATSSYNIWRYDRDKDRVRPVTQMPMGIPSDLMVEPELIKYKSFDGLEIPAFLYLPRDPQPGNLPAIVYIHGGPEGQFRPAFNPVIQYFVYRGYAVIAPNVRGSDGYGKKYLALDDRFKRLDSVRDLEGLHRWIEQDKRIDPKRVALMGGSYGGYMVLAGLAFQPELWAAGVDMVGIANLVTFLENTSSYRRAVREAEYGYLATDREFLESASPLNKADDIRAPLFIIHGANDPRVPLSEAQQIAAKLTERKVPVQLLVYEDEGHGLAKLKNRLDAYPKVAAFLDEVLGVAV